VSSFPASSYWLPVRALLLRRGTTAVSSSLGSQTGDEGIENPKGVGGLGSRVAASPCFRSLVPRTPKGKPHVAPALTVQVAEVAPAPSTQDRLQGRAE
jgi:hypothetical protein